MKSKLTKNQYTYLKNKKSIEKNQWGNILKSFRKQIEFLKEDSQKDILKIFKEEDRVEIIHNLIYCLNLKSLDTLVGQYNKDKMEVIKILSDLKSINSDMGEYYEDICNSYPFRESLNTLRIAKKIHKKFPKRNIIKDKDMVLGSKIARDFSFINENKFRINLFKEIFDKKLPIRFKELLIKKNERDKYILKEFYEFGIIIPKNITKSYFFNLLKNKLINRERYLSPLKKNSLAFEFRIFKYEESSENLIIKINPYYRDYLSSIKWYNKNISKKYKYLLS